jgi:uncharacterized protein (UPF0332 family)
MTPEALAYLTKARQSLNEARIVLANDLAEAAGRAAYLAAFHAAQAYIFDTTGKAAKTHTGVRSEFARLAKDEARLGPQLSAFLARAYTLKTVADYAIGDHVGITLDEASAAIVEALAFVEGVSRCSNRAGHNLRHDHVAATAIQRSSRQPRDRDQGATLGAAQRRPQSDLRRVLQAGGCALFRRRIL